MATLLSCVSARFSAEASMVGFSALCFSPTDRAWPLVFSRAVMTIGTGWLFWVTRPAVIR